MRRQLIAPQGPEAILHTEDERFPWQQEILVWHLGRFLSVLFSAGALIVTYAISLELFRSSRLARSLKKTPLPAPYTLPGLSPQKIAVISAAFLAFNPRFLFTGMLFSYDSLTLLLASLFLWLAIRVAKGYYPRWGFWGLGGLAGLTDTSRHIF
jgi:4-amino-4-deoxy-L-arabinose transferase-like glycosyltransferase